MFLYRFLYAIFTLVLGGGIVVAIHQLSDSNILIIIALLIVVAAFIATLIINNWNFRDFSHFDATDYNFQSNTIHEIYRTGFEEGYKRAYYKHGANSAVYRWWISVLSASAGAI